MGVTAVRRNSAWFSGLKIQSTFAKCRVVGDGDKNSLVRESETLVRFPCQRFSPYLPSGCWWQGRFPDGSAVLVLVL